MFVTSCYAMSNWLGECVHMEYIRSRVSQNHSFRKFCPASSVSKLPEIRRELQFYVVRSSFHLTWEIVKRFQPETEHPICSLKCSSSRHWNKFALNNMHSSVQSERPFGDFCEHVYMVASSEAIQFDTFHDDTNGVSYAHGTFDPVERKYCFKRLSTYLVSNEIDSKLQSRLFKYLPLSPMSRNESNHQSKMPLFPCKQRFHQASNDGMCSCPSFVSYQLFCIYCVVLIKLVPIFALLCSVFVATMPALVSSLTSVKCSLPVYLANLDNLINI